MLLLGRFDVLGGQERLRRNPSTRMANRLLNRYDKVVASTFAIRTAQMASASSPAIDGEVFHMPISRKNPMFS